MPTFGFEGLNLALDELANWQQQFSVMNRLQTHGESIEERAKAKIGHYQDAIGPFPAWEELKESTQKKKSKRNLDQSPLLWDGFLHDDITHEVRRDSMGEVSLWVGIPEGAKSADYARRQERRQE